MGDNIFLPDRNGVRTPMQWDSTIGAGFSLADPKKFYAPIISKPPYGPDRVNVLAQQENPDSLWHCLRKMIQLRKSHEVLGLGNFSWIESGNRGIISYTRFDNQEILIILNNLTGGTQSCVLEIEAGSVFVDLFSKESFRVEQAGKLSIELQPYQFVWLELEG
jgi:maltose alpha-D-glucosyltransferase / alpha-amylase